MESCSLSTAASSQADTNMFDHCGLLSMYAVRTERGPSWEQDMSEDGANARWLKNETNYTLAW
jgi:hypothetical protein